MRKHLFAAVFVSLLLPVAVCSQELCPDVPGKTAATHRFLRLGERIVISLADDDCVAVALNLHWSNGRNSGSNFNITLLDANNRPIYAKQVSAFMSGVFDLPFASIETQSVYGSSMQLIAVPSKIIIETVSPFAGGALSYRLERIRRANGSSSNVEKVDSSNSEAEHDGNQIVSIRNVARLIGTTRIPLVQIDLKTDHPFPAKDEPLKLQIGKKIFVEELSGDYTGRKLTLSLTPEMFAALNDGDEIIAFFGANSTATNVWHFGKLQKNNLSK
jgi:hypothetical protein